MEMNRDIEAIQDKIRQESAFVPRLVDEVARVIVGQRYMVERLLIGLLADGHVLMEGVPGLAKTMTVRTLARAIQTLFHRIQFTPDLLPADLIGTLVYDPQSSEFKTKKGPIFANIILADEINRSPAKVQSALLEAMQERTVTIGDTTYPLDVPFLVLATQNPIEQEGTYPLPEAQVDRFMLKLSVEYPSKDDELEIMRRMASRAGRDTQCPKGRGDHLHGPAGGALHRRSGVFYQGSQSVRLGPAGRPHRLRCVTARIDIPGEGGPGHGLLARSRVCDSRGCALGGDGRVAASGAAHL